MRLSLLARGVPDSLVLRGGDYEVSRVVSDSRQAGPGDLFVATAGATVDGHDYAWAAAEAGAAVALEREVELAPSTPVLRMDNTRWGLGELAAELLGRPARRLLMAGITGTDGKTTTAHLTTHLLRSGGLDAGCATTVAFDDGVSRDNGSGKTTAEAPVVQEFLAQAVASGVRAAVVETTSHALVQGRVAACDFDVAAVTNVGIDHLDYHRTWDAYASAKASLIELAAAGYAKGVEKAAVLNLDDRGFEPLSKVPIPRRWTFSLEEPQADFTVGRLREFQDASRFTLVTPAGSHPVELRIPARFNVQNALCAAAVAFALGVDLEHLASGLSSFEGVRGRLDRVEMGQPFRVLIDFAHSSGALSAALAELRRFTSGRLLLVFGATGRADHDRVGMGRAAAGGADYFVITTDDPVHEDPVEIAREVQSGVMGREPGRDFEVIIDRRQAIRRALQVARDGDTVLLAGKGHERTMNFGRRVEVWDEVQEVRSALQELGFG